MRPRLGRALTVLKLVIVPGLMLQPIAYGYGAWHRQCSRRAAGFAAEMQNRH